MSDLRNVSVVVAAEPYTGRPGPRLRRRPVYGSGGSLRAQPQAAPLRVNPLGAVLLPVWVAWKPMLTEPPGGMVAL